MADELGCFRARSTLDDRPRRDGPFHDRAGQHGGDDGAAGVADEPRRGLSGLEWTVNAYLLAFACFLLTGAALGMWGALAGTAAAFGPLIGGAVVEGISWHWIFWVNVPVGIAIVALAPTRLRESFGPRPRFDAVGVALAAAGSLAITWALVRGNDVGWGSAEVLASLAAGVVLGLAFLLWEARSSSPMIPLELFRRAGFANANVVSFSMYGRCSGCSS